MILLFSDFATSTLAGPISNTATTASLQAGGGALFPIPTSGEYFRLVFNDAATGLVREVVYVTAMSGDTISTMVRGQEGTTAQNWLAGDLVFLAATAGSFSAMVQMPAYAGNPNGNVPGFAGTATLATTAIWDTVNLLDWYCTTTGNAAGAAWTSPILNFANNTPVGGNINQFYNPTCAIAQRGPSVTVSTGTSAYTLDGCIVGCAGASVTASQAPSVGLAPYSLEILGQSGVTDAFVIWPIESFGAFFLAGQYAVFQVKCLNNTGSTITPTLTVKYAGSKDTWSSSTAILTSQALQACPSGTTTTLNYTFSVPSGASTGMSVRVDFDSALNGGSKSVSLGDRDIRPSAVSTGTLPKPAFGNYSQELLFCQRYLPGQTAVGFSGGTPYFSVAGYFDASNTGGVNVQFFTPSRVPVTGVVYSALSDFKINYQGAQAALSSLSFDSNNVGPFIGSIDFTTSGLSSSAGQFSNLIGQDANALLYFTGAELNGTAI
jgi:hypothetical protein